MRPLVSADYDVLSPVIDEWWGGRAVSHLLPRLFFEHFSTTSFALVEGDLIRGFLVGFRSQILPEVAYIHFVGVSPECRGLGFGTLLYSKFFEAVAGIGCSVVECITSPVNEGSIAFHIQMGFEIVETVKDHAGPGKDRVLFRRRV